MPPSEHHASPEQSSKRPGTEADPVGETRALPDTVGSQLPTQPVNPAGSADPQGPHASSSSAASAQPGPSSTTEGQQKTTTLGDFRILAKLGAGGMGAVYKAHQMSLDREVALKVLAKHLAANTAFVERFYREARTLARLDHPHIVRGYAVGEQDGWHYFAMEFIDGASAQAWMKRLKHLSVGDALHVILACANALQHAQEFHIIHRDIKPDNILITKTGIVKLADMGLAKAVTEDMSLTESGTGFGTPYYMAPEQARNAKHADLRSDIYALGGTLYYLATGQLPFPGETLVEITAAKERGQFLPARRINPDVPERLDLIIDKMLAKDPQYRYQSYSELISDLQSLNAASPTLQFLQKKEPPSGSSTRPPGSTAPTAPTRPAAKQNVWYLRAPTSEGRLRVRRTTSQQLHQLIKNEHFDINTTVSQSPKGKFLPLGRFPEFEKAVRERLIHEEVQRKTAQFENVYQKLERQELSRRRWRWLRDLTRRFTGGVGLVVYLAALGVVGYLIYKGIQYLQIWHQAQSGGP